MKAETQARGVGRTGAADGKVGESEAEGTHYIISDSWSVPTQKSVVVVNLSGRGDEDVAAVAALEDMAK